MYTTYRLNADELDMKFVKSLRSAFKGKEIEIAVCETAEVESDETAYLLQSEVNRNRLLKAIDNIENGHNLVTVKLEKLP